MKVLVISPHSDDELIGVGGSLLKWKALGYKIKILLVCCSDVYMLHLKGKAKASTRRDEFMRSNSLLSTEDPVILGYEDSKLDTYPQAKLVSVLDSEIDSFRPDMFIYPEPSYHQDHQYVSYACNASLRPTKEFRPKTILNYEIPTSIWTGNGAKFNPNYFVDVSETMGTKLDAFQKIYKSQVSEDRKKLALKGIADHARYRGMECGVEYAESFQLLFELN